MTDWIKATSTISVTVPGGSVMLTISRKLYSYDDYAADGWDIQFTQRRPNAGSYTVHGTTEKPIMVIVYDDGAANVDRHVCFVDKTGNPLLVYYGLDGVSAVTVFNQLWLPGADYDFSPLFIKYGNG